MRRHGRGGRVVSCGFSRSGLRKKLPSSFCPELESQGVQSTVQPRSLPLGVDAPVSTRTVTKRLRRDLPEFWLMAARLIAFPTQQRQFARFAASYASESG